MFTVKTLNKISNVGLSKFDEAKYSIDDNTQSPDAIMVRSAAMHDMEMPESLLAIARAGAGVNNIPIPKCTDLGIAVFNTPGANANAVKELVICGLLLASRKCFFFVLSSFSLCSCFFLCSSFFLLKRVRASGLESSSSVG